MDKVSGNSAGDLCFSSLAPIKAPCHAACPASLNCPAYLGLIEAGRLDDAYLLIRDKLPLVQTLGRVCNAPCEGKCRRAQMDMPVAIRDLKRFVADSVSSRVRLPSRQPSAEGAPKVAVVGGGPAGLSAAYDLARAGVRVTVFEDLNASGGLLAVGCPEFRLPKKVLRAEIQSIADMGVEIQVNRRVANVNSFLEGGYDAVFVATGAHSGRKLAIPGSELGNVLAAVSFLRIVNLEQEMAVGSKVVVLGGGGVALDCARTAIRLGAEVHVACLETRTAMPAIADEIAMAEQEGVIIHPSRTPVRILSENGLASGVECLDVRRVEFDERGSPRIDTASGSEHILRCNTVIFAVGQQPDANLLSRSKLKLTTHGTLAVDPDTSATNVAGVFAGGDVVRGAGSVIQAIADGQKGAASIIAYLNTRKRPLNLKKPESHGIDIPKVPPQEERLSLTRQRGVMPELPSNQRRKSLDEATLGYSAAQAQAEASRCLRCDLVLPAERVRAAYGDYLRNPKPLEEDLRLIECVYQPQPGNALRRALLHNLGVHKKRKRRAENVLMLSCGVFGMALQVVSSMKLLDRLGVDYTYLNEEYCCGLPQLEFGAGSQEDFRNVDRACSNFTQKNLEMARKLTDGRFICFCQWCTYTGRKYRRPNDIDVVYLLDVVLERVDKLRELAPALPKTRVGYFEGCHLRNVAFAPGVDIAWKQYRKLLEVINGVEIVDLPSWKCCVTHHKEIVAEAQRRKLSCIVTPCAACWSWLEREGSKTGLRVKMSQDILVEALGEKTFEGMYLD